MSKTTVNIDKLAAKINEELKVYGDSVLHEMQLSINLVSRRAKEHITELSPQRKDGTFKTSYITKQFDKKNRLHRKVGNREYQLAHLLEDGHKVYTRHPYTKYDRKVKTNGPFKIKHRYTHGPNPKVTSSSLTSSYSMFKQTAEYASEELYNDMVKRLKKLGRKGKL